MDHLQGIESIDQPIKVAPLLPRDCIAWHATLPDNNDTFQHSFLSGITGRADVEDEKMRR